MDKPVNLSKPYTGGDEDHLRCSHLSSTPEGGYNNVFLLASTACHEKNVDDVAPHAWYVDNIPSSCSAADLSFAICLAVLILLQ